MHGGGVNRLSSDYRHESCCCDGHETFFFHDDNGFTSKNLGSNARSGRNWGFSASHARDAPKAFDKPDIRALSSDASMRCLH